jgi:monoamine oxidase
LKKIDEDYKKYWTIVSSKQQIALQEHHIIPWNNEYYTKEYLKITKKYGIDTKEKLRKWWKNNRFLYPHLWKHLKKYHEWLLDRLEELSQTAKNLEEFEKWLDDIAKKIIEDPVWKWLISEKTLNTYIR